MCALIHSLKNTLNDAIFNGELLSIVARYNGIEYKFDTYGEKFNYVKDTVLLRKSNFQEGIVRFD